MKQDWIGNKKSTFATLGASSHTKKERQSRDYYATDPAVIEPLLKQLVLDDIKVANIWENAVGGGHLADEFVRRGYKVFGSDIEPQKDGYQELDFLNVDWQESFGGEKVSDTFKKYMFRDNRNFPLDIITNPPYKYAQEWVEKSLDFLEDERYLMLFLKVTFLEGQARRKMFEKYPPKYVYVFSKRQKCAINGDFENTGSSAAAYAWYVWKKGYTGETIIKWI